MSITVFSLFLTGSLNCQGAFAAEASSSSDASKLSSTKVSITGSNISADLKAVSLKTVLDKLQKEYGLQYKTEEGLLQREVSVRFKEMPIEEGINKILAPLSSLIVYDEKGKIKRLYVVDVSQGEKVVLKSATALQTSPSADAFKDYMPLPFADFTPVQITSGPFVEPGLEYKPLPPYDPDAHKPKARGLLKISSVPGELAPKVD